MKPTVISMRSTVSKALCLAVSLFMISGCAATSLKDTWRNPNITVSKRIDKLLVVRLSGRDGNRRLYEDVLASELQRRGVQAVAGHQYIPDDKKQSWESMQAALEKTQADAVLTLQTVSVEQHTTVQPAYPSLYPGYWYPSAFSAWDLRGYYGATMYYDPATISTYQVASIQANLFEAASGKLIWAATVETSEPDKSITVTKKLAEIVVRALMKEGLI